MRNIMLTLTVCALIALPAAASAECFITGDIAAAANDGDPSLGAWMYTMTVSWDTGAQTSLSHLDLIVDFPGGTCLCSDVAGALNFGAIAGTSDGTPGGCDVDYTAEVECYGDPSIPGDEGILIKWEPMMMDGGCEPGPTGTGMFTFYSDLAPAMVDDTQPLILEKDGGESCEGTITGVFPALPCDPVAAEATTWTEVKGLYNR
jgi:hypothetical protein